jgi:hypothetical protein
MLAERWARRASAKTKSTITLNEKEKAKMKRTIQIAIPVFCLLAMLFSSASQRQHPTASSGLIVPVAQAQVSDNPLLIPRGQNCNNGTLQGYYGVLFQGTAPGFGDFVAVAHVIYDGAGKLQGKGTVNVAGHVVEDSVTGTYQVAPDCTLTGSITYPNWGLTVSGTGVIVNGGKEISYISTSPSQVLLSGTVKKM